MQPVRLESPFPGGNGTTRLRVCGAEQCGAGRVAEPLLRHARRARSRRRHRHCRYIPRDSQQHVLRAANARRHSRRAGAAVRGAPQLVSQARRSGKRRHVPQRERTCSTTRTGRTPKSLSEYSSHVPRWSHRSREQQWAGEDFLREPALRVLCTNDSGRFCLGWDLPGGVNPRRGGGKSGASVRQTSVCIPSPLAASAGAEVGRLRPAESRTRGSTAEAAAASRPAQPGSPTVDGEASIRGSLGKRAVIGHFSPRSPLPRLDCAWRGRCGQAAGPCVGEEDCSAVRCRAAVV